MKTKIQSTTALPSRFEPGYVAPVAPVSAAPELDSATDHFAHVEVRRVEMLEALYAKKNELTTKAAELNQQAKAKRGEAHRLAPFASSAGHYNAIATLNTDAAGLENQASHILKVEQQQLQFETESLGTGMHPTLTALRIGAQGRVESDLIAKLDRTANGLASARRNFDEHLAQIATTETLTLAQALVDAARVANVRVPDIVFNLLAAHGPKAAA
jgi:hypothetical protein